MPISGEVFRQLGRAAAGAVSVVSAYERSGDGIVALTVSSFGTLSYEPPLAMFAIQHDADSYTSVISLWTGHFCAARRSSSYCLATA